ncbi:MAG: hypothetical protein LRY57_01080 [Alphaproteobacteria bacterium]|nr:hypothetical protein [Alphaproteobacteria bacterium]
MYPLVRSAIYIKFNGNPERSVKKKSTNICGEIEKGWDGNLKNFEEAKNFLDGFVSKWDLNFKREYPRKNGYITYYFRPPNTKSNLDQIKNDLDKEFKNSGIGSSFHWLDQEWYKKWLIENPRPLNFDKSYRNTRAFCESGF